MFGLSTSSGQSKTLGENNWRFYNATGELLATLASGVAVDHGTLLGLADDDHTQYVLRSILTTNGDLFTRASGLISRLGIGNTNEVLTVVGGAPTWAASAAGSTITVEEEDGVPSVSGVDTIIFDQGDGFSVTDNMDGSVTIGVSAGGFNLTVEEADSAPSVSNVDTIVFDQADGFTVTDDTGGQVTIGFSGGSSGSVGKQFILMMMEL